MPFTDQTIFVTGFPGFIAERLVKRIAKLNGRFILLVQPALLERARLDVKRIAEETGAHIDRLSIAEGDITEPDLGMSAANLDRARQETSTLFHLAAVYDLAVPRDLAMRVNLDGTRNVNQFARSLAHLRRYHYIYSCYVAGNREGLIMESDLIDDAGFRNHYEATKYLAELEV